MPETGSTAFLRNQKSISLSGVLDSEALLRYGRNDDVGVTDSPAIATVPEAATLGGASQHRRDPDRLAGLKSQAHRCKTTGDIKTGAAFDADWLQRDRIVRAADQHIGSDHDPDRNACSCASISAG